MTPDSDEEFDAIAAARELEEALSQPPEARPSDEERDRYLAVLEVEMQHLQTALAQKDALLEKANRRADQAHDEIEAAQRRLAGESERVLEQRTRKLMLGFLEVVDDLDRAIAATKELEHNPQVLDGFELVRRELLVHLGQLGVSHFSALGEPFDPVRHEAMALVPATDAAQDGLVINVVREGYAIGEEILRPAGVAVAKIQ